jgi:K+-transporting ATPase c subunit
MKTTLQHVDPKKFPLLSIETIEAVQFGFLSEPRVNVLGLNRRLDQLQEP